MTREEKNKFIDELAVKISSGSVFYLADTSELTVENTNKLRRSCFKSNIQLQVVKNALLLKAFERIEGVAVRAQALAERLTIAPYPELGESLDLQLYLAWKMLAESSSRRGGDYTVPMRRAYSELCRKTAMLEPERRNQFLQQVPANRQILRFAQEEGLADPAKLEELMKRKQSGLI